jgi:hypothetical protein
MSGDDLIPKQLHGEPLALTSEEVIVAFGETDSETVASSPCTEGQSWPFDYIFPELACENSTVLPILKKKGDTVKYLTRLGQLMLDDLKSPGVPIPTIYTFFGQFVDHDITHEKCTQDQNLSSPDLMPLSCDEVRKLQNARSPNLELDSVYGSVSGAHPPRKLNHPEKLKIDKVSNPGRLPQCATDPFNDLPRETSGRALIGDERNDENVIIAQLHVAFLRAHNALVDAGYTFKQARKLLIQHYQWIVLEDFLPRVADPMIVKKIRTKGAKFFPIRNNFFTPLEFSVAAYRFGHSKVRQVYDLYNELPELKAPDLVQIFTFTKFAGTLSDNPNILGTWIIDWKNFLKSDEEVFFSRRIDTTLAFSLLNLQREREVELPDWKKNLAVRNLLRSYYLRIPTGQAVATAMHEKDQSIVALTPSQIASAVTEPQYRLMKKAGFLTHTPLWFYILAEAMYYNKGYHLGPVGSTIVAETLIGILRYSNYSILSKPGWRPTLGLMPGKFDLEDLLILAGVYSPGAKP